MNAGHRPPHTLMETDKEPPVVDTLLTRDLQICWSNECSCFRPLHLICATSCESIGALRTCQRSLSLSEIKQENVTEVLH
jgi:hypothetical protein